MKIPTTGKIGTVLAFVSLSHKLSVLTLLNTPLGLSDTETARQAFLYMKQYGNQITLATIFWGLWLFPFGYLVYHSGFLPRLLGVLLMVGCFGYVFNFIGIVLLPDYRQLSWSGYVTLPASISELAICLYLTVMGVRKSHRG